MHSHYFSVVELDKMSQDLDKIIKKQELKLEIDKYDKYIPLFQIAINYLKKKSSKALLYGGTAINSILPKDSKFYRETELPDLDIFSTNAIKLAHSLMKIFKKHKYPLSSVQEALHTGTWKVTVDGVPIADITQISRKAYKRFEKNSIIGDLKIRVCNPEFLRSTLYVMLSQPSDAYRWKNIATRLKLLNKYFPPTINVNSNIKALNVIDVNKNITSGLKSYVKEIDAIWTGDTIIKEILGSSVNHISLTNIVLVKDNAFTIANDFITKYTYVKLEIGKIIEESEFMSSMVQVVHDGIQVALFSTVNNCLSYVNYKGINTIAYPTLLRILYEFYFHTMNNEYLVLIHRLINIQQKHPNSKLLELYSIDCLGPTSGIYTMRRERFQRLIQK